MPALPFARFSLLLRLPRRSLLRLTCRAAGAMADSMDIDNSSGMAVEVIPGERK